GVASPPGLITGGLRSLLRSFSAFKISFFTPPRSSLGSRGSTGLPRSALGDGFGGGWVAESSCPHPDTNPSEMASMAAGDRTSALRRTRTVMIRLPETGRTGSPSGYACTGRARSAIGGSGLAGLGGVVGPGRIGLAGGREEGRRSSPLDGRLGQVLA